MGRKWEKDQLWYSCSNSASAFPRISVTPKSTFELPSPTQSPQSTACLVSPHDAAVTTHLFSSKRRFFLGSGSHWMVLPAPRIQTWISLAPPFPVTSPLLTPVRSGQSASSEVWRPSHLPSCLVGVLIPAFVTVHLCDGCENLAVISWFSLTFFQASWAQEPHGAK